MRIAITGGGTGGHIYPAVAVLDALKLKLSRNLEVLWIGTSNRMEAQIVPALNIRLATIEIMPLKRGLSFTAFEHNAALAWNLLSGKSFMQAARHLAEFSPDCLLSTGGYVAYPACKVAAKLNIPLFIIEPNSTPGLTTLKTAKLARAAFCASTSVASKLGRVTEAIETGVPIRTYSGGLSKEEILEKYGLSRNKKTIFITGGSLGASFVNKTAFSILVEMIDSSAELVKSVQVLHQTGKRDFEVAKKLSADLRFKYIPMEYVANSSEALYISDVLIGRSGASTVAEAAHFGIPAVFFPYMFHKDNQQILNALPMVQAGVAFMHREDEFSPEDFKESVLDALAGSANPEFRNRIREFDRRAADAVAGKIAATILGAAN